MLHNLEMPTQIYHMAALGLSEFWKTPPQFIKIGGSRTARSPWPSRFSTNLQEGKICCKSSYNVVVSRNIQSSHESRIMRGQETIIVIVIPPTLGEL